MKITEPKPGQLEITCDCGLPVNQTSVELGMDCSNHCEEKKYKNLPFPQRFLTDSLLKLLTK